MKLSNFSLPCIAALTCCMPGGSWAADPFTACPEEAFLVQGASAVLYGVDLSTGRYRVLSTAMGTTNKLNGMGFNFHDNYLYAWSYDLHTIVRIGDDYLVEHLSVNPAFDSDFYIGDISLSENVMYLYRKGSYSQHGLWRVPLDPASPSYLQAERIVDGETLWLKIFDFAFHPQDGQLYSVAKNGDLIRINPLDGSTTSLSNIGETGTFGAVYFDVDGRLYASRNADGAVFQIDLAQSNPTAVWFAQGPSSSNNDGARCAMAPVVAADSESADYGDAPDSYGTLLGSNGARHNIEGSTLFLGSLVDGEPQAYPHPLSDEGSGYPDEDGVTFITEITAGSSALVQVDASASGYINAWIDFDRDGFFDQNESIASAYSVQPGTNVIAFSVPFWTREGNSWARFRISSEPAAGPLGGLADGEVEDYALPLRSGGVSTLYYPSSSGFVTLAYEDLWPSKGDYDLNDLVVHYRTSMNTISSESGDRIVGLSVTGAVTAVGASFHSGFAVAIPGLPANLVDQSNLYFTIDGQAMPNPLESGHEEAVFVIFNDVWNVVTPAEGCSFYRTERFCAGSRVQANFELTIPLLQDIARADITGSMLFNPFIFATPGYMRNSIFPSPPGRGLEVHLKNEQPTALADPGLLGRADDRSDGVQSFYITAGGLPFALEIGTDWSHPWEYTDILDAYPKFLDFVNTSGAESSDWYLPENAVIEKLYED